MVRRAKVFSWIGIAVGTAIIAGTGYTINLNEINRAEFIDKYLNNPNAQAAVSYVAASNNLEKSVNRMGKYIVIDDNVEKVKSPEVNNADRYLDNAVIELSKLEDTGDYINRISEIDSKVLSLKNKTEFTKADKDLGIETSALSRELDDIAIEYEPNIHEILHVKSHDRVGSILMGIFGTALGGIAIGASTQALYTIKKGDKAKK